MLTSRDTGPTRTAEGTVADTVGGTVGDTVGDTVAGTVGDTVDGTWLGVPNGLPPAAREAQAGHVDEAEQRRRIESAAAAVTDLLAALRREQLRRRAAGEDTGWLDQVVPELEALADDVHVATVIRQVVARHGPGPYLAEELAAIGGVDPPVLRRVLDEMVRAGLATPDGH